MIKIYGSPNSSANRCYWALEEMQIPYERQEISMRNKEHKSEAYLKLNPNGKIPCIVDGDFVLWESVAINHYLALKYAPRLLGTTLEEKALVEQWIIWASGELQPHLVTILIQVMFMPEDKKNPVVVESAKKKLEPIMTILNNHLENKNNVVGNQFTLADLQIAAVIRISEMVGMTLLAHPNIEKWFSRMSERPAYKKVAELSKLS